MRASAPIAAMVVKAPMVAAPSAPQVTPIVVGRGVEIDQRSPRDAAAPPLGKVGAGGTEFGALGESRHRCGRHAAVLPFKAEISRSGRIGISVSLTPVALRMALASAGEVGTVATSPIPTLPPST